MSSIAEINELRITGANGTPGLLCWPKASGTYSCAMILHERYGLVAHTEDLARRLAAQGFAVLAPDIFWDHPDQEALHRGDALAEPSDEWVLRCCEDVFPKFNEVKGANSDRFGMIGVCQTGRYPLVWAAHHRLDAAVVLYGAAQAKDWIVTEKRPSLETALDGMVKTGSRHVLGIFGEGDFIISVDDVLRLRGALERRNISYDISIYPDVPHGWLNDTMPGRYRPVEAKLAWDKVVEYLRTMTASNATHDNVEWSFRLTKSADYDFKKNVRQ